MHKLLIICVLTLSLHLLYSIYMPHIQIRVDQKTKRDAQKVATKIGLDLSGAIKMFLKQMTIHKGLPFLALTENGYTPEQEEEILRAAREAELGVNLTKKMSVKQALKYLDKLN